MKKIIVGFSVFFVLCGFGFTQANEEIALPEVTTVIDGENITAGLDSMPDFSDVLIDSTGSGNIVPQLPEVEIEAENKAVSENAKAEEKSIYAEGQLGGGYPSLFTGDFSVYRLDGDSPFNLAFHHNSSAGYSGHTLTDGYNSRDTSMSVDQTIIRNQFEFKFGGLYETLEQGLQNKVSDISNYNADLIDFYSNFTWNTVKGFSLGADFDGSFYDRYADITSSQNYSGPAFIKNKTVYEVSPAIFAKWNKGGFNLDFNGRYLFTALSPNEAKNNNSGNFGLGFSWQNLGVKLYSAADLVFGSQMNEQSLLVPFTVGVESAFPVSFSNRRVSLVVEGGLNAWQDKISLLEKQYKYTSLENLPGEASEWYGKFDLSLPLKSAFTGNMVFDFRKTAFNNGRLMPLYDNSKMAYGQYGFEVRNVTMFQSQVDIAYHYKLLSLMAGWYANWLDVPALESSQMIRINISLQSEASKWGVNLLGKFGFGDDVPVPVLSIDGFVRLTPAVRIVACVDDIIKLVTNESRIYAGQYIAEGGNVSLLVKFFF